MKLQRKSLNCNEEDSFRGKNPEQREQGRIYIKVNKFVKFLVSIMFDCFKNDVDYS